MDNMEGELYRRLAVLTVLYFQRRTNPNTPKCPFAKSKAVSDFHETI